MNEIIIISDALRDIQDNDSSFINVLDLLSEERMLLKIIDQILNEPDLQDLIAARSYDHFNGFYKMILYKTDDYKLRLHVWLPSEVTDIFEHIHYHRWPFVSKILKGVYYCNDYRVDPLGDPMYKYVYSPRSGKTEYDLSNQGFEPILLLSTKPVKAGDYLISRPLELHRVIADRSVTTVSLVLQGKDEFGFSMVYNEEPICQKIDSPPMTPEEFSRVLKQVKNLIKANE